MELDFLRADNARASAGSRVEKDRAEPPRARISTGGVYLERASLKEPETGKILISVRNPYMGY